MDFGRVRNLNRIDWSFAPAPLVANAYPLDVAPARTKPIKTTYMLFINTKGQSRIRGGV